MDALIHGCVVAAQKCYNYPGDVPAAHLENKLEALNLSVSDSNGAHQLSVTSLQVCELLNLSAHLLPAPHTPASLRAKLYTFLYNLAWFNIPFRSYMAGELQLCNTLYEFLKFSLRNDGGPRTLVQGLQLMQVLTYDHRVVLGPSWTNDLIGFLINEICREHETQWMPYCIGILNNLCTNIPLVRDQIRRNESVNSLYRRLINFLSHQSTSVVICSLSLVSYLEEKLRNTLNSESSAAGASTSSFERALLDFKGLDRSLEQVATLLVELESANVREQLSKDDRSAMQLDVGTPVPEVCLKATEILKLVLEEAVNCGHRIQDYVPPETLLELVETSVKTSVETGHPLVSFQCKRIVEGLKLAEVISQDDEMRNDLLDNVTAPLCAHMAEFQMLSNPVAFKGGGGGSAGTGSGNYRGSHSSLSSKDALPSWSGAGVEILLELLQILAALKDHSYPHKQQYWKLLKDERMLPFLAFGITSGKKEIVHGSLQLILHCSQVHQFPLIWLSELVAWHTALSCEQSTSVAASVASGDLLNGQSGAANGLVTTGSSVSVSNIDDEVVDELIEKMKNKLDLQDPRISQVIAVYEKKINTLLSNGRQLEELLESKQGLLMQHEKLITQYRLHKEQGEHELSKLRSLIRDGEMANEETSAKILVLQEERDTLRTHLDTAERTILSKRKQVETLTAQVEEAQAKVENLLKELEVSDKEIESEKEMQNILRGRYNELKQNFDTTSQKLFNAEGDLKRTRNSLHEKEAINSKLETDLGKKEEIIGNMERNMQKQTENLRRCEEERRGLLRQLDEKNDKIGKLDEKLKEQQKLIEMIGRMTAQRNS